MSLVAARPAELPPMRIDPVTALREPVTRAACDFWESRRHGKAMPSRKDLDHAGMRGFIAHVGLISCIEENGNTAYLVKLAGSRWEAVFGRMGGRFISEFLEPAIEARWRQPFDHVRRSKTPKCVTARIAFESKNWLDAELLVAPLSENGEDVSMLFLAFVARGNHSTLIR